MERLRVLLVETFPNIRYGRFVEAMFDLDTRRQFSSEKLNGLRSEPIDSP